MAKKFKCDQCVAAMITYMGKKVFCHETGCPNTHKVYDKELEEWVEPEPENNEEDEY